MEKDKKKTLTISTSLKKKIDTSSISSGNKKSFSVEKKILINQIFHLILILVLPIKKGTLLENSLNNRQQKNL